MATTVEIRGNQFVFNSQPTYPGRMWRGHKVEGLLLNSRMVQATFDDLNPETRPHWDRPGAPWDPDRNLREFLAAMPTWRAHGLTGITVNLQGGSPSGYSNMQPQPWDNSAFGPDGSLRQPWLERMRQVIDKADEIGMAVILGFFYFGQEPKLIDEAATIRACDAATDWVCSLKPTNVLVEIANECNVHYQRLVIRPERAHELIERVQKRSAGKIPTPAGRLLVSTSYGGGTILGDLVAKAADFLLLHGNGMGDPAKIAAMVDQTRALPSFHGQPVLFNEDDHFGFDKPENNFVAAVAKYAGWGYFDYRMKDEGLEQGYQSVPVEWGISSDRKRGFFGLLKEMTGS